MSAPGELRASPVQPPGAGGPEPVLLPLAARRKRRRDWLFLFGLAWLALLVVGTLVGRFILPDPTAQIFAVNGGAAWPRPLAGADALGRDLLARTIGGAWTSLSIGLTVQTIVLFIGILVGVIGEFGPAWIASPLLRLTDAMFAFPDILLAILVVSVLGQGFLPVIVALAVAGWPTTARLVKTQAASLRDREFVVAARAGGASKPYLVVRHILPQLVGLLLAVSVVELAGTILAESTLSFLGIGVRPPTPTWGTMINDARQNMQSYPWQLVPPCVALTLTIVSLSFVGDGLRDRFDPKRG